MHIFRFSKTVEKDKPIFYAKNGQHIYVYNIMHRHFLSPTHQKLFILLRKKFLARRKHDVLFLEHEIKNIFGFSPKEFFFKMGKIFDLVFFLSAKEKKPTKRGVPLNFKNFRLISELRYYFDFTNIKIYPSLELQSIFLRTKNSLYDDVFFSISNEMIFVLFRIFLKNVKRHNKIYAFDFDFLRQKIACRWSDFYMHKCIFNALKKYNVPYFIVLFGKTEKQKNVIYVLKNPPTLSKLNAESIDI